MMRVAGALLVCVTVFGGLKVFFLLRNQQRPQPTIRKVTRVPEEYELEVTLTFDAVPDEFAVDPEDSASLIVEYEGETVYAHRTAIKAGSSVRLTLKDRLVVGANELYVRATPSAEAAAIPRAIRVRVRRGESIVADESIWAEAGGPAEGPVTLVISGTQPTMGA